MQVDIKNLSRGCKVRGGRALCLATAFACAAVHIRPR